MKGRNCHSRRMQYPSQEPKIPRWLPVFMPISLSTSFPVSAERTSPVLLTVFPLFTLRRFLLHLVSRYYILSFLLVS